MKTLTLNQRKDRARQKARQQAIQATADKAGAQAAGRRARKRALAMGKTPEEAKRAYVDVYTMHMRRTANLAVVNQVMREAYASVEA
jgi:hypothetical protein